MTALSAETPSADSERQAQFRYGAVFLLVLALLVFEVIAPDSDWSRAGSIALAGAALTVAAATSRARGRVRRARAIAVAAGALVAVLGVGTGLFSQSVSDAVLTLLLASIPVTIVGGLGRLIRSRGVTAQVVAGALAVYLVVGLLFASAIGFVSHVESGPFFKTGEAATDGDRVYYSFTVLTTTGFGDYTSVSPVGHALAVLEMLTGQLYLVTVIGILVGSFAGRRGKEMST